MAIIFWILVGVLILSAVGSLVLLSTGTITFNQMLLMLLVIVILFMILITTIAYYHVDETIGNGVSNSLNFFKSIKDGIGNFFNKFNIFG